MPGRLHAVLVGIDEYPPGVRSLQGCRNDVRRMKDYLELRASNDATSPVVKLLEDAEATRAAVIAGFRETLAAAGPDDVALFYYSGHGAQALAPEEYLNVEPDRKIEGIVCYDSRLEGQYDLADKELGALIAEVAAGGAHTVAILDCCHSGTGTRDPSESVRRAVTDDRARPMHSFLVPLTATGRTVTQSGWPAGPANHVLVAACRAEEEAKEIALGGEPRGVFSYFLLETLKNATVTPTYRDLVAHVTALVRARAELQWPQLEAIDERDVERAFLGGIVPSRQPYLIIGHDEQDEWAIDAGAVHGIPPVDGEETTRLAIFPRGTARGSLTIEDAIGQAKVTEVLPAHSKVDLHFDPPMLPTHDATFDAIVVSLPLARLPVRFEGDAAGVALVRAALAASTPAGGSLYIAESERDAAEFRLQAIIDPATGAQSFRISRGAQDRLLVADLAGFSEESARVACERLEHLARWTRLSALSNPTTQLGANPVRMQVFLVDDAAPDHLRELPQVDGALELEYRRVAGAWRNPQIKIRLENVTARRLHCMLLDLNEAFGVFTRLLPAGRVELGPGEAVWAFSDEPIDVTVPDQLAERGFTSINDQLKLIVSTAPADPTSLREDDLELPDARRATRDAPVPLSTLDRLLQRVTMRHMGGSSSEPLADWTTSEIALITRRPRDGVAVPAAGEEATLAVGVVLEGHATLAGAIARLATAPDAARSLDHPALPPMLVDDPTICQPLELMQTRSGRPGTSVLELELPVDGAPRELVLDDPLVLRLGVELGADEHVLPVAWDGEFFLPLGRARHEDGATAVLIERLPDPTGTRTLGGSIKIFLRKVVGRRLGLPYEYPLLSATTISSTGEVEYDADPAHVAARVAAADRIVLFVHGLIGDTRSMMGATPRVSRPSSLAAGHDLVLAFDYENIHTPIEETARALGARLDAAGLGPGHAKTLDVVAHSLGGLVARWFVEREGGALVVTRVVMLGTPNGGSPWPTIQSWATIAVGLAINGLAATVWPVQALPALLKLIESVDNTLDALAPGSPFLASLAASPEPEVRYVVVGGNTSIITQQPAAGTVGPVERLLAKLRSPVLMHRALGVPFFGQPNDIAVSVASATTVPDGWSGGHEAREVPCDHVTYFRSESGLTMLEEVLTAL
jgi:hypothetical protein